MYKYGEYAILVKKFSRTGSRAVDLNTEPLHFDQVHVGIEICYLSSIVVTEKRISCTNVHENSRKPA